MMEREQLCFLGETATGKYPIECVKTMDRVALAIEKSIKYWKRLKLKAYDLDELDYKFNMNYSVCTLAANIHAKAIIAYTNTGETSRMLSSFETECPIFAITENEITYRQLRCCLGGYTKIICSPRFNRSFGLCRNRYSKEGRIFK